MRYLMCLLLVLIAAPSYAVTYYVSTTGSNANNGTDESTPFATLKHAVTVFQPGDTILVRGGTYNLADGQTILISTRLGTQALPLVIKNYPGERPILNWDNKDNTANRIYVTTSSTVTWLTIEGFEMKNGYEGMKCEGTCNHMTFRRNWIHGFRNQGFLGNNADGLWEYNRYEHNGNFESCTDCTKQHGIYADGDNVTIQYNEFIDNLAYGVQQNGSGTKSSRNWKYLGNTFAYQNYRAGIVIWGDGSDNATVENNIFYENSQQLSSPNTQGVDCSGCTVISGAVIRNNHFYASGSGGTAGIQAAFVGEVDTGNVVNVSPPSFVNGGTNALPVGADFRISSGSSPTVNMGLAQAGRIACGSATDAGAYEMPTVTSAVIVGNTLDVTVCTAVSPMQLGTWTVDCSGCGPRTVTSQSITGGGLVRLTVSGAACINTQTWTVSAANNNTDSSNIAGLSSQLLPTVTAFAVNSAGCTGSGSPTLPGSPLAVYNFEGNTQDSSANANHAVGSANITYAASKHGQGVQLAGGTASYVDTGLLSGHNPSTTHLVVAFGVRVNSLGLRRTLAGTGLGTDQRFYIQRESNNTWEFALQANGSPISTEFPVTLGDQHVCVKFNPTTDTATMYVNGQPGVINGASVQAHTSFIFPSVFRWGLPSASFVVPSSWDDILDQAVIYTTDVSCADIYAAWEPTVTSSSVAQAAHQWQGVYLAGGLPENRGAVSAQRTITKGGAAALVVQMNCTGGSCGLIQPRLRYNLNGGAFNNVVPLTPTADGVSMWGPDANLDLNANVADGPLGGTPGVHTDGVWLLTDSSIPSVTMNNNTSYTLGASVRVDTAVPDPLNPPVVCFKVYDQNGTPLASYTPTAGACLTVIPSQAMW